MDNEMIKGNIKRHGQERILKSIINTYKVLIEEEPANVQSLSTTPQLQDQILSAPNKKPVVTNLMTTEGVKTSDHPPCGICGNVFFIRTGSCFACITCGSSAGCS